MLVLNTIAEFQAIPVGAQQEILKAIKTKDRLELWLRDQNKKKVPVEPHWAPCSCIKWGQPGWRWIYEEMRDNSDIHPSQIDKCIKYHFHACAGDAEQLEEYIDPRLRMIFDMGHAWHDTIQRYGKNGAWCEPKDYHCEKRMDPDLKAFDGTPALPLADRYWIKGSVDAVIEKYYIPYVAGIGEVILRLVHEYKTISSGGYSKLNRPDPKHKKQATIYSAVFNAPVSVLVYTNKDNCQMADFPIPFDNSLWNDIAHKCDKIQQYVSLNVLPPWAETAAQLNPVECTQCGFRGKVCNPPVKGK